MDPYALSDTAWCKELGRRLDRLREDRKMSRDELGKEIGVSQPTIRRLLDEGHGKLSILIAALRSLEALDQLETFIEPPPVNPALLQKKRGRTLEPGAISDRASRGQNQENDEDGDLGW
ncbi:MAG: helix-turn-helix domain-containing protein [Pseudomonadota bacterium]